MALDAFGSKNIDLNVLCALAIITDHFNLLNGSAIRVANFLSGETSLHFDSRVLTLWALLSIPRHVLEAVSMDFMTTLLSELHAFDLGVHFFLAVGAVHYLLVFVKVTSFILDASLTRETVEEVVAST